MNSTSLKTLGSQAAKLVTTLHERSRVVFRLEDVREITGLSEASARSFVRKLVDRGVAARLKPGLYVLVPFELGWERQYLGVSDLERTIVDGLRQPEHCGGLTEVARGLWMRREDVKADRLVQYARRIGVGAVVRRLGFLLETYEMAAAADLDRLRAGLTATYVRLDPVLPAEGKRLRRWRLQLNIDPEELLAVVRT